MGNSRDTILPRKFRGREENFGGKENSSDSSLEFSAVFNLHVILESQPNLCGPEPQPEQEVRQITLGAIRKNGEEPPTTALYPHPTPTLIPCSSHVVELAASLVLLPTFN